MKIEDSVAAVVVAQLLFLEAENPEKPISLYINSPGGSVTAGMAIYDTVSLWIQMNGNIIFALMGSMYANALLKIHVQLSKPLSSISNLLYQRFVMVKHAQWAHYFWPLPIGGTSGQASDIAIHAREILRVRERLNKIYQKHTNKHTLDEIEKAVERDYFMTAQEALEFGLVDRVLEKREIKGADSTA
ncbi:9267_t:CDS:2 [Acaulospora colombiana]|uniref:9267_t:CDS:1 n=1 Tax=Acaulospora colombiana TaxID=27376 RepID=A0ACA9MM18_9GLOM|nr:9267_t:CDS:2 [Acaulospora colombiana]